MHPISINQIAQDQIAERIRAVERERMVRQSGAYRPGLMSRLSAAIGASSTRRRSVERLGSRAAGSEGDAWPERPRP